MPSALTADRRHAFHAWLSTGRLADYSVMALAIIAGGGSIALFAWSDRPVLVNMGLSPGGALLWNAGLSCLFFAQHSVMVRRSIRRRLAGIIPARYDRAFYAISSGVVLTIVVLLLQPDREPLVVLEGVPRAATAAAAMLAVACFGWAIYVLRGGDLLGLHSIREHLRADRMPPPPDPTGRSTLTVTGPYRWVRHPLYSCVIMLLWADPEMGPGRLMFAALWTAWIYVGARLEERDLVLEFGDAYRRYRRRVPILIPWRGRVVMERETPAVAERQA